MMKRVLLLAGMMLALVTAISADWPVPPCDPCPQIGLSLSH